MLEKITRILKARKVYQARDSTTLVNNTTKTITLTVPNGKIWFVHQIMMHNGDDVSRNMDVFVYDDSGNILHTPASASAVGAGERREMLGFLGTSPASYGNQNGFIVKGGNKLGLRWVAGGTSSGGTAYYCITYEEMLE